MYDHFSKAEHKRNWRIRYALLQAYYELVQLELAVYVRRRRAEVLKNGGDWHEAWSQCMDDLRNNDHHELHRYCLWIDDYVRCKRWDPSSDEEDFSDDSF